MECWYTPNHEEKLTPKSFLTAKKQSTQRFKKGKKIFQLLTLRFNVQFVLIQYLVFRNGKSASHISLAF